MNENAIITFCSPLIDSQEIYLEFKKEFGQFGKYLKLYLNYNNKTGSIIYEKLVDAEEAYSQLTASNNLELEMNRPSRYRRNNNSFNNSSGYSNHSRHSSQSNDYSENVETTESGTMYDAFGNEVPILHDDNTQNVYVPLSSIEKAGFKLYQARLRKSTDRKGIENLKAYLLSQAHLYMHMNNLSIECDSIINNVVSEVSGRKDSPLTSTPRGNNRNMTGAKSTLNKSSERDLYNYNKTDMNLQRPSKVQVLASEEKAGIYWVSIVSNAALIEQIHEDTRIATNHSDDIEPFLYSICAAKLGNKWYRGYVHRVNPPLVILIDVGRHLRNDVKLKSLPEKLAQMPGQAIRIKISSGAQFKHELQEGDIFDVMPILQYTDDTYLVNTVEGSVTNTSVSRPNLRHPHANFNRSPAQPTTTVRYGKPAAPAPEILKPATPEIPKPAAPETPKPAAIETPKPATPIQIPSQNGSSPSITQRSVLVQNEIKTPVVQKKTRRSVADLLKDEDEGCIQYLSSNGDNSFIAFIVPQKLIKDLSALEEICKEAVYDPEFRPNISDTVAVKKEDDEWVRAIIIEKKGDKYSVALIDYGTVMLVDKVCKISEELQNICEFAVSCEVDKFVAGVLKEKGDLIFEVKNGGKVTVTVDEDPHDIICKPWTPVSSSPKKEEQKLYASLPPIRTPLKTAEMVMIVGQKDGMLYLRSKTSHGILKDIHAKIKATTEWSKLNNPPAPGRIVMHRCSEGPMRAVVVEVKADSVTVEYLDYPTQLKNVAIDDLLYAGSLAEAEATTYQYRLNKYKNKPFCDKAEDYIKINCILTKTKYTVSMIEDNCVELTRENKCLSDVLKQLEKPMYRTLADLPEPPLLPIGQTSSMMVWTVEDLKNGVVYFNSVDDEAVVKFEQMGEQLVNYDGEELLLNMHVGELCVAKYEGEWYRAYVREIDPVNDKYLVHYIDFGNQSMVSSSDIREMKPNVMNLHPLAITCRLKDLLGGNSTLPKDVVDKLEHEVVQEKILETHILAFNDGVYDISLPTVKI